MSTKSPKRRSLERRHSITICESKSKKRPSASNGSSGSSSGSSSSSTTPSSRSPRHSRVEDGPQSLHPTANYTLNVSEMHATLQEEMDKSSRRMSKQEALTTLNLRLDEVAHIRSVLTKAELESLPIDGDVRADVEKGKVRKEKT